MNETSRDQPIRKLLGWVSGLVLACSSALAFATDVALSAPWSYSATTSQVVITVDEVVNLEDNGTSGSLQLELWVFGSPYTGTAQIGFHLATQSLAPLQAGYAYQNLQSGSLSLQRPPKGIWYMALLLTEWDGSTWATIDYMLSDSNQTYVCTNTSCQVVVQNQNDPQLSLTMNRSAYMADSDDVLSLSAEIDSGDAQGQLVDLYISVHLDLGESYYLGPDLQWTASVVPVASGFSLADIAVQDFYSIPIAGLPVGSYQFSMFLTEPGGTPDNSSSHLSTTAVTSRFLAPGFQGSDITFNPGSAPIGEVGVPYLFDYYPFVSGGSAPYYFTLDSGGGFPPIGLQLQPNGFLSGVPSVAGEAVFTVCAVDLGANQDCQQLAVRIRDPQAPAVPVDLDGGEGTDSGATLTIDSANCSVGERFSFGTIAFNKIIATGTASGPVGSALLQSGLQCTDWSDCERSVGEPESTSWTHESTTTVTTPQTFSIGIATDSGFLNESEQMTCPIM